MNQTDSNPDITGWNPSSLPSTLAEASRLARLTGEDWHVYELTYSGKTLQGPFFGVTPSLEALEGSYSHVLGRWRPWGPDDLYRREWRGTCGSLGNKVWLDAEPRRDRNRRQEGQGGAL